MKGIYAVRAGLSTLLSGLEPGLGTELEQINWDEKNGGGGGLKGVASWAADNLGQIIFDLHHALKKVMPRAQHHPKLLQPQIQPIRTLHVMYQQALHLATTELNRQFSSQFVSLKGADKDRKYLENGYLPNIASNRLCISCSTNDVQHAYVDEPNSNRDALARNLTAQSQYDAQRAIDETTWANGGIVTNSNGGIIQHGRKRPQPKLQMVVLQCHCAQFGCTTSEGEVPKRHCPIQCIDNKTGQRYKFDDITGKCLCPICSCDCHACYTVSIDSVPHHYIYEYKTTTHLILCLFTFNDISFLASSITNVLGK